MLIFHGVVGGFFPSEVEVEKESFQARASEPAAAAPDAKLGKRKTTNVDNIANMHAYTRSQCMPLLRLELVSSVLYHVVIQSNLRKGSLVRRAERGSSFRKRACVIWHS
jgi:hypothetical protein